MFSSVSYRRSVLEGVLLYTLGRLGALVTPAFFPAWLYVALPLLFLALQYLIAPVWATRRIQSTKRERLSKRFWLLGPCLAALCFAVDLLITLTMGLALGLGDVQRGPVLWRLFAVGPAHLSFAALGIYELKSFSLLFTFFTIAVVCTRLAQGGFLRFTMPAGGNRVTL
jgi:hypothetical protein